MHTIILFLAFIIGNSYIMQRYRHTGEVNNDTLFFFKKPNNDTHYNILHMVVWESGFQKKKKGLRETTIESICIIFFVVSIINLYLLIIRFSSLSPTSVRGSIVIPSPVSLSFLEELVGRCMRILSSQYKSSTLHFAVLLHLLFWQKKSSFHVPNLRYEFYLRRKLV